MLPGVMWGLVRLWGVRHLSKMPGAKAEVGIRDRHLIKWLPGVTLLIRIKKFEESGWWVGSRQRPELHL